MEVRQRPFSLAYVIVAAIVLFMIQLFFLSPHRENLAYSDFKVPLSKGKVSDPSIAVQTITGTVATSGLEGLLSKEQTAHVRFAGRAESPWLSIVLSWIVPAVIFFDLWSFMARRMGPQGSLMGIGKNKASTF